MSKKFEDIEILKSKNEKLVEVELMLTPNELKTFADYCLKNEIKFNDWVRKLAHDSLELK